MKKPKVIVIGLFLRYRIFYLERLLAFGVIILKSLDYALAGSGYLVGMVKK